MNQQREIERLKAKLAERGIDMPTLFMTPYGYKRARCFCGAETLIRGYTQHYSWAHSSARKGRK
jgi:hypothetical protein